jgi:nucleoside phosphorylase
MLMLVFALPEEARALRRRIRWQPRMHANARETGSIDGDRRGFLAGHEVSLSFVGIGGAAIDQVERAVELIKPQLIISSGFAGATRSLLEPGDFVLSTNYTTPDIGQILDRQKFVDASGSFVQVKEVASMSDKWSLNHSARSIAVDMESEIIADLCRRKQISMVTARMISDAIDETIPGIFVGKKVAGLKDLSDAAVFAARMLRLTGKLADRLESLVGTLGSTAGTNVPQGLDEGSQAIYRLGCVQKKGERPGGTV